MVDLIPGNLVATSSPQTQKDTALGNTSLTSTYHVQSLGSSLPWTLYGDSLEPFSIDLDSLTSMPQEFPIAEIVPGVEVKTSLSVAGLSDAAEIPALNDCPTPKCSRAFRDAVVPVPDTPTGESINGGFFNFDWNGSRILHIPFLQFEAHLQLRGTAPMQRKNTVWLVSLSHGQR